MSLEQRDEGIQAGPVIEIAGELSALQWQAWHVLLAHAYDELADKTLHAISVVALESALGFSGETPDALKEVLRALRSCQVEWRLLNEENEPVWGIASLLTSVEVTDGICTYGFAPSLRQKLYDPAVPSSHLTAFVKLATPSRLEADGTLRVVNALKRRNQ